jgi:hypothetical protein
LPPTASPAAPAAPPGELEPALPAITPAVPPPAVPPVSLPPDALDGGSSSFPEQPSAALTANTTHALVERARTHFQNTMCSLLAPAALIVTWLSSSCFVRVLTPNIVRRAPRCARRLHMKWRVAVTVLSAYRWAMALSKALVGILLAGTIEVLAKRN